jgi:nucleotide-binding universal stress UspA family protein
MAGLDMTIFGRVLVTLDGSDLAERGLTLLGALRSGVEEREISLLRVVAARDEAAGEELLDEARRYLETQREACPYASVQVLTRLGEDTAAEILSVAETGYDLVVLMTQGQGGIKRWVWGSVAERVVRHCSVPLFVGNAREAAQPETIGRILVPLDGSERAASILDLVTDLALALRAEVVLVSACWIDAAHHANTVGIDAERLRTAAEAHLRDHAATLTRHGVDTSSIVALNEPAELILKAVESTGSDMIAMTTHGRSGVKRWLLGSVAEKVMRASPVPVLLLRVGS